MPAPVQYRNVEGVVQYHNPVPGNAIVIDFTKPDGEEKAAAFDRNRGHHKISVQDLRGREDDMKLFENGFSYVHHAVEALKDCETEEKITEVLLPATEDLVKKVTGATRTRIFNHRIRNKPVDQNKVAASRAPAPTVHSDMTPVGAAQLLKQYDSVESPEDLNRLLQTHRIIAMNVWRPLKTVRKDPLAVCDWKSVDYERDWIADRLIFPDGSWSEPGMVMHNDSHQWYYLSHQTPEEPLLFVQYDSAKEGGMSAAHVSFVDDEYVNDAARESIEIKMFAFVPKEV